MANGDPNKQTKSLLIYNNTCLTGFYWRPYALQICKYLIAEQPVKERHTFSMASDWLYPQDMKDNGCFPLRRFLLCVLRYFKVYLVFELLNIGSVSVFRDPIENK